MTKVEKKPSPTFSLSCFNKNNVCVYGMLDVNDNTIKIHKCTIKYKKPVEMDQLVELAYSEMAHADFFCRIWHTFI